MNTPTMNQRFIPPEQMPNFSEAIRRHFEKYEPKTNSHDYSLFENLPPHQHGFYELLEAMRIENELNQAVHLLKKHGYIVTKG